MKKDKAILLFSGGFDSVALLHDLVYRKDFDITLLFYSYGQSNEQLEFQHCNYWANKFDLPLETLVLNNFNWTSSSLYKNGNINHNNGSRFDDQYIEMRNLIFNSYALSYAQSAGANVIYSAIIEGLTNKYPDATVGFVKMFDALSSMTTGIEFVAPYSFANKYQVVEFMKDLDVDVEHLLDHSYSCNTPKDGEPCGECGDCKTRKAIRETC